MEREKTLFRTPRVSLKETPRGFQYLERKGKDSVAIFLIRRSKLSTDHFETLIRYQPLSIDFSEVNGIPKLFPCPMTGSIDENESPQQAANRETFEEAGFAVEAIPLGHYIVGTQTNEVCYMFYADVTSIEPQEAPQDGSFFESVSQNQWQPLEYLSQCEYGACQLGYFRLKSLLKL
jgi:hypothetical protein